MPLVLSTREFAGKIGVSPSTVTKWLRSGKIRGRKRNGRWQIPPQELSQFKIQPMKSPPSEQRLQTKSQAAESTASQSVLTIAQFSEMTYLTEFGVKKWLKQGRLVRAVDGFGNPGVDAVNLENPLIKRLIRES